MIEFLNDHVRTAFHELPIEKQREFQEMAERFEKKNQRMKLFYIEQISETQLEVSIRLYEKLKISQSV